MSAVKVLVVPAAGVPSVVEVEPSHEEFCALVGDLNTDTVFLADGSVVLKAAANGRASGLPENGGATRLAQRFLPGFADADGVVGTGVFVGVADAVGYCDVPVVVLEAAAVLVGGPAVW